MDSVQVHSGVVRFVVLKNQAMLTSSYDANEL